MKATLDVSEANFEAEVLKSAVPVVVDFWAPWCGPCKMLAPALDQVATEMAGRVKIAKVNVDDNQSLALQYHVQSIPMLLYFSGGKVVKQSVGVVSKREIVGTLEQITGVKG